MASTSEKKTTSSKTSKTGGFRAFINDPRVLKIIGIILFSFGAYLFFACLSYLFTGGHDQHLIQGAGQENFSENEPYKNWMGKMGAHLAHFFMFTYLGVGAFFVSFIVFIWGWKIAFTKEILPFYKSLRLSILGALYFPLAIGFFFHDRVDGFERKIQITCNDRFVGGYGHFATEWTTYTLGWAGTLMLLVIVLISYLIFNHNHKVDAAGARISDNIRNWKENKERLKAEREREREREREQEQEQEGEKAQEREKEREQEREGVLVNKVSLEGLSNTSTENQEIPTNEIPSPSGNTLKNDFIPQTVDIILDDEEDEIGPEPYLVSRTEQSVPASEQAVATPVIHLETSKTPVEIKFDLPSTDDVSKPSPPVEPEPTYPPEPTAPSHSPAFELDGMEVEAPPADALSEEDLENALQEFGPYDPKLDLSRYKPPTFDLLKNYGSGGVSINQEELEANKNRIVETLNHYKIDIDKIKATIGPTVTLYEIVPAPGVRISKIKNLEDDIALSLAALGIRIIAPIPGKGTIGIEVPNSKPDIVSMRSLIASDKFQNADMDLPVVLGKTISNETFVADLAKMPHLLMAGATGQGKSVGLNAILVSLLYKKHPSQIKFVLVDPKKVELTLFNKIERHFLAKLPDSEEAIITDTSKVVRTLNSLCIEMDERYELLKIAQCRNIKEYNNKFIERRLNPENGHRYLPYIVLVVDEFADLIMTAGREVETPIARLAQLARAIGIHLIIATQRPSVNIITGTIKANFPARIAFRVTSKIDSRTILDAGGADQLIGRGDMLYSTGNDLIRIQCGFVDTPEVEEITDFIGNQQAYPSALLLPEVPDENSGETLTFSEEDRDSLFEDAARIVVMTQQGSASLLQRKLKLGYNRAGRLVDQLEAAGIIGPFEGSKARKVLIPDEISLEHFLNNLKGGNSDF